MTLIEKFQQEGYVLIHNSNIVEMVQNIQDYFVDEIHSLFTTDSVINRTLLKRFGDSLHVSRVFSSNEVETVLHSIGIHKPIFCGPVVTHFTSNDHTGNGYGIPFHQDYPSMASSLNSIVAWVNIFPIQNEQHTLEIVPRSHTNGLHRGRQSEQGYILDQQIFEESIRLVVPTGSLLLFSPWLVHRTFVSPTSNKTKLAVSRRFDDLACSSWKKRGMQNAYQTTVDRNLYLAY